MKYYIYFIKYRIRQYKMPVVNKKPCVNNSNFSFSGKECSPLGKGYSADAEQIGTIMEGRDGSMWMIGIKNGVKVWNRVPTDLASEAEAVSKSPVASPKKQQNPVKRKPSKSKVDTKVSESESSEDDDEKKTDEKKQDIQPAPKPTGRKVEIMDADDDDDDEDEDEVEKSPPPSPPAQPSPSAAKPPTRKYNKKTKPAAETTAVDDAKKSKGTAKAADAPAAEPKGVKAKDDGKKAKRAPTDFNIFMSYQLKVLTKENPELPHTEKFSRISIQWKQISEDERKAILEKAKAEK